MNEEKVTLANSRIDKLTVDIDNAKGLIGSINEDIDYKKSDIKDIESNIKSLEAKLKSWKNALVVYATPPKIIVAKSVEKPVKTKKPVKKPAVKRTTRKKRK